MYWNIGKRIFEEEQEGKGRADYGKYLIKYLSEQLKPEFGSGFTNRQLERYRQFYRTFPIATALRTQLSWTQYKLLLSVGSEDKSDFSIAKSTIITHLQEFLLELGTVFSFTTRQKRIHLDEDYFVSVQF